jgi:hypothetical protein
LATETSCEGSCIGGNVGCRTKLSSVRSISRIGSRAPSFLRASLRCRIFNCYHKQHFIAFLMVLCPNLASLKNDENFDVRGTGKYLMRFLSAMYRASKTRREKCLADAKVPLAGSPVCPKPVPRRQYCSAAASVSAIASTCMGITQAISVRNLVLARW